MIFFNLAYLSRGSFSKFNNETFSIFFHVQSSVGPNRSLGLFLKRIYDCTWFNKSHCVCNKNVNYIKVTWKKDHNNARQLPLYNHRARCRRSHTTSICAFTTILYVPKDLLWKTRKLLKLVNKIVWTRLEVKTVGCDW